MHGRTGTVTLVGRAHFTLDAIPHVVDVVMVRIGARHVLRHDGHPVHQTSLRLRRCWRIVVVVVDGRRGRTVMMSNVVVVSLMVMMMMRCNRMLVIVIVVVLLMLLLLLSTGRSSADANGSLCRCRRSSS